MDRFAPQKGRLRPFLLCGLSVGPIGPIRPIGLGGGGVGFWSGGGRGGIFSENFGGGVCFFCGKNLEIGSGIINFVIQKFIENSATSKLIGILFKLNEIPSKRPFSNGGPRPKGVSSDTGGLQRCGCPQILYLSEFHHIPLMWLHIEAMARVWHTSHELSLFLSNIII